jgi:hypothetical protein
MVFKACGESVFNFMLATIHIFARTAITGFVTIVTTQGHQWSKNCYHRLCNYSSNTGSPVEQELLTLPENLSSPPGHNQKSKRINV